MILLRIHAMASHWKSILFGAFSLLLLAGCTKDGLLSDGQAAQLDPVTNFQEYLDFKAFTQVQPRSTDYSIAESLDYLNDGLNLLYCRPGDTFGETLIFIDTFNIQLNASNRVDEDDLEAMARTMANFAGTNYYDEQRSNKAPLMFEVRQGGNLTGFTLPLAVAFIMEAGSPSTESDDYPYIYSWPFGFGQYLTCEIPVETESVDLFRCDLREAAKYKGSKHEVYYYVNLYTICYNPHYTNCLDYDIPFLWADEFHDELELLNLNDPNPGDNQFEMLLFYREQEDPNYSACLLPVQMNFYYDEMLDIAVNPQPSSPASSKVISNIEVGYNEWIGMYGRYIHGMQVYYSDKINPIVSNEVPIDLPNP
jgi:hypothetical protein